MTGHENSSGVADHRNVLSATVCNRLSLCRLKVVRGQPQDGAPIGSNYAIMLFFLVASIVAALIAFLVEVLA